MCGGHLGNKFDLSTSDGHQRFQSETFMATESKGVESFFTEYVLFLFSRISEVSCEIKTNLKVTYSGN